MLNAVKKWIAEGFGIDYRSLVALRVGVASALLLNLFFRSFDLEAFYTDFGVFPRSGYLELADNAFYLCFHSLSGLPWVIGLLFLISAIFAAMLLLGYRTRFATVASWVLLASLQERNPMVTDGQDQLLRMLVFWGMFLPWGDYGSVDAAVSKEEKPKLVFSAATVAYYLQILLMYWITAWRKDGPEWRVDGSAALYALNMDFATTALGAYLAHFADIIKPAASFSFWLEVFGPFLLFIPNGNGWLKIIGVVLFAAFHIGLAFCFILGLFPFIDVVGLFGFIPSMFWNKLQALASRSVRYSTLIERIRQWFDVMGSYSGPQTDWRLPRTWRRGLGIAANILVSGLIALMLYWNAITFPNTDRLLVPALMNLCFLLRIDQNWDMFSSFLPQVNGWYVITAELVNGQVVDISKNGRPVSWQRPALVSDAFGDNQWSDWMCRMFRQQNAAYRRYWGGYLCRQWNLAHDQLHHIAKLTIYYMYEGPLPETNSKDRENPQKLQVWQQNGD